MNWFEKFKEAKILADKLAMEDNARLFADIISGRISGKTAEERAYKLGEKYMTYAINIIFAEIC